MGALLAGMRYSRYHKYSGFPYIDYLRFLADRSLVYRMIMLHCCVLSATLPPVVGHTIAQHPLILRLLRGVFQNRPARRFFSSLLHLNFVAFQRKFAFLLAMASSRRPSKVALLRCGAAFMVIEGNLVRFYAQTLTRLI